MSKSIDIKEVSHIAKLSNLKLKKEELKLFSAQLSKVIDYVKNLENVDTSKKTSTSNVTGLKNILRNDEKKKNYSFTQDEALSNTKEKPDGYFKVKSIFKDKDT